MNYKKIGFGLGAFAIGAAAWTAAAAAFGPASGSRNVSKDDGRPQANPDNAAVEHVPTDLMGDTHPGNDGRAVEAFRPDPTAVPTEEEREALRPATGPAPTLVADRGSGFDGA